MSYLSQKIIKSIIKDVQNHQYLIHSLYGFLVGSISVPSIIKFRNNKKSKQLKRTEARIKELDDINERLEISNHLCHKNKYINKIKTAYLLKTNIFSKHHIQISHITLTKRSKKDLHKIIIIKAYKPVIKDLIRWCNRFNHNKIDYKYFCQQAGTEYLYLIKNNNKILHQFNKNNNMKACYNIYRQMRDIKKRGNNNE